MIPKRFCPYCGNVSINKYVEGRVRRYCEACALPLYENPVPATCLVVADGNQRILLVKRSVPPKKGLWCLPGGFMELGETPEGAGLRELREETGLTGKVEMLLGVVCHPGEMYDTILMTGYLVRQCTGNPVAGDDAEAVGWFAKNRLPEIAFATHQTFIDIFYSAYAHSSPSGSQCLEGLQENDHPEENRVRK